MTTPAFLIDRSGPVLTVTFNRAERLNAFRRVEYHELHRLLGEVAADRSVRAVVLTGAGRGFCAGEDLKELDDGEETATEEMRANVEVLQDITRRIVDSPAVFIAAVNGVAAGFGAELAVACDLRVGGPEARFLFPEVRRGLFITNGVSLLLPRIVGATWAAQLLLSGQPIDAATAARIGLLTEVVPGGVAARAAELGAALAGNAPTAMRETKRILRSSDRELLERHLHDEVATIMRCLATGEHVEGARAFVEKRPPRWPG
ncbi:MAG: enoyl-CoA hydratase/isomerase family protein [Gemmatimonadetes bacterium]|nr:enoyl-CoA hydratase/isomerase family protein [Gemmatimonadota bacterium]